jgi:hypothetical protein
MAMTSHKGPGRVLNMAKLGGRSKKLALKSDMKGENMAFPNIKKAGKSAPHKKV